MLDGCSPFLVRAGLETGWGGGYKTLFSCLVSNPLGLVNVLAIQKQTGYGLTTPDSV